MLVLGLPFEKEPTEGDWLFILAPHRMDPRIPSLSFVGGVSVLAMGTCIKVQEVLKLSGRPLKGDDPLLTLRGLVTYTVEGACMLILLSTPVTTGLSFLEVTMLSDPFLGRWSWPACEAGTLVL